MVFPVMEMAQHLNPHAKAPAHIRDAYRSFLKKQDGQGAVPVLDFEASRDLPMKLEKVGILRAEEIFQACMELEPEANDSKKQQVLNSCNDRPIYEHNSLPGRSQPTVRRR
jgi:hypothetical protein